MFVESVMFIHRFFDDENFDEVLNSRAVQLSG